MYTVYTYTGDDSSYCGGGLQYILENAYCKTTINLWLRSMPRHTIMALFYNCVKDAI